VASERSSQHKNRHRSAGHFTKPHIEIEQRRKAERLR
jgi:hypothetical protein